MSVDKATVAKIASLARIRMTEEELERMAGRNVVPFDDIPQCPVHRLVRSPGKSGKRLFAQLGECPDSTGE